MALPVKVFWQLSSSIPRLLADEGRGDLEIITAGSSPEGAETMRAHLMRQAPEPIELTDSAITDAVMRSSVRDEAGFNDLRSLM